MTSFILRIKLQNRVLLPCVVALSWVLLTSASVLGQEPNRVQSNAGTTIRWTKQEGVSRYRLQIASDESFKDVLFDGRVAGEQYIVRDLSPGVYYWRIAPADYQTREFQRPVRFEVNGGVRIPTSKQPIIGWCSCESDSRPPTSRARADFR